MKDYNVPAEITLTYRPVGKSHVFTAVGVPGLYICSSKRRKAFDAALPALSAHISQQFGCHVTYSTGTSYDDFEAMLEGADVGSFMVVAHRSSAKAAA